MPHGTEKPLMGTATVPVGGVVHCDAKFNEAPVEVDPHLRIGLHQPVRSLAHELNVNEKPLRRAQLSQQAVCVTAVAQHVVAHA